MKISAETIAAAWEATSGTMERDKRLRELANRNSSLTPEQLADTHLDVKKFEYRQANKLPSSVAHVLKFITLLVKQS